METVALPNTNFRFVFMTDDPKELTAHLDTLDALQVRRPRHLQTQRCWWTANVWMEGEDSPIKAYAAPEDIEHRLVELKQEQAAYFRCDVRITGLRRDLI